MNIAEELLRGAASRPSKLSSKGMSASPRRKVAVLTCMDTRIDVLAMLGLERGDANIIRNAGGLVTDDVLRSLSASQRLLGTEEVIVVMHEDCGLHGASDDGFTEALAADGSSPPWRLGAFEDLDATLLEGLSRLRAHRALAARDQIHGLIFDPTQGTLREPRRSVEIRRPSPGTELD